MTRAQGLALAGVLCIVVSIVDYITGRELQIVPLYLLPVGIATWGGGRRIGMIFVVICTLLWLAGELALHVEYGMPIEPYWNAAGLFLTFAAVCWILSNLQASLQNLERKVELRTAALHEEMERRHLAEEARLQAERLAVVGTMAAQVAHEVRNPLGSMTLNIELLHDEITDLTKNIETPGDPAQEARFLLSQLQQELNRIRQVLDSYMQLARLPKIEARPFPLHDFLRAKLQMIEPELQAANVHLVQSFDPALRTVIMDCDKLWQVLVNLIRNARQAMPDGGRITVTSLLTDHEMRISVTDTGKGINPANMAKIFTPFYTTKTDGTGLGLVLAQQIIGEMGGRISCTSQPASGATFTLAFPLHRLGLEPTASNPSSHDNRTSSPTLIGSLAHRQTPVGR